MSEADSRRELWHRLDNETGPAYAAFEIYANLHPRERSVRAAYRIFSDNPDAPEASKSMQWWSQDHAWAERAKARDHHFQLIRERGMESAIEEEAHQQATSVERLDNRFNELMAMGYTRAMEWLEDSEWANANLRSGDVVKIIELHLKAKESQSMSSRDDEGEDWNEEEIAERERIARLVDKVDAAAEDAGAWGDDPEREGGIPQTD